MANKHQTSIKEQRIAAYEPILSLFPSATDMARELSLDNRATVGQWKRRGVPIEYIMILDILGMVSKDVLVPAISNWDMYLSKYEQVIRNKLNKMLLVDSLNKTATSTLQSALEPAVTAIVYKVLAEKGLVSEEVPEETQAETQEAQDNQDEESIL